MDRYKKKCIKCHGSGEVMGLGYMKDDCKTCHGTGKEIEVPDDLFTKGSPAYKESIKKMKKKFKGIKDEDAEKYIEDAVKELK